MTPGYYTVVIHWVPAEFQTKWHPEDQARGTPFETLTRGAFETVAEAIDWARAELNGTPYALMFVPTTEVLQCSA